MSCLEPACGAGHMAKVLKEYFGEVRCADAFHYGYGPVRDFLTIPDEANAVDWVITNPPFRLAEEFVSRAFHVARKGVAILARTVFLESVERYEAIYSKTPPSKFAQFVERVPCSRAVWTPRRRWRPAMRGSFGKSPRARNHALCGFRHAGATLNGKATTPEGMRWPG